MNKTLLRLAVLAATVFIAGWWILGAGETQNAHRIVGNVTAPDGVTIGYEIAGEGDPTLVFIHGWSCDRSYWNAQIGYFAKSHRVLAIDLGGHGESGLNRKNWTMRSFGDDVRSVLGALDLKNVVLVGHSMGGSAAAEAAAFTPNRVAAVVAVDSFTSVWPEEQRTVLFPQLLQALRADFPRATKELIQRFFFTPESDQSVVTWIMEDMSSAPPSVGVSSMENAMRYDQGAALSKLEVPVHLLNADYTPTDLPYW